MTAEWSGQNGQTWWAMPRAFQVVGLAMFCTVLAAVAAATCILSYSGMHILAEQGGIQAQYARGYPLLIDSMLVIVLGAVLALRGAGLPSRILSWFTLMVLLAAAAGAEALHATRHALPRDAAAITVTVLPWLLVLVTFVLLLAMLRHAKQRQVSATPSTRRTRAQPDVGARDRRPPQPPPATPLPMPMPTAQPQSSVEIVPGFSSHLASAAAAGAAAGRAAAGRADGGSEAAGPSIGEPARSIPTGEESGDPDMPGGVESRGPPAG
jgi:hypothetical protein